MHIIVAYRYDIDDHTFSGSATIENARSSSNSLLKNHGRFNFVGPLSEHSVHGIESIL